MTLKELRISPSAPLNALDTATQTYGCRHRSPHTCPNGNMPNVCAFVTNDNICRRPPNTWKRKFIILKDRFNNPI